MEEVVEGRQSGPARGEKPRGGAGERGGSQDIGAARTLTTIRPPHPRETTISDADDEALTAALIAFYTARLDEYEQDARNATRGEWAALDGGVTALDLYEAEDDGWPVNTTQSKRDREDRVHIARHHPDRVLRKVKAGRLLLAEYEQCDKVADQMRPAPETTHTFLDGTAGGLETAIAIAAQEWDDHPDFDDEWRP